jgi:HEPN domain-containing protein
MNKLLPIASLLLCAAIPARAQAQEAAPSLDTLFREMRDYAEQADEFYKQAARLMGEYGYAREACHAADRAVQYGIRSRNRILRARKQTTDPGLLRQLGELRDSSTQVLNIYKTLFNENCGNEPYPLTE